MLVPEQMEYDELHHMCIIWTIFISLSMKLISGYTSIILCEGKFGILCLTPTRNSLFKKNHKNFFHQKTGGKRKQWYFFHWKEIQKLSIRYNLLWLIFVAYYVRGFFGSQLGLKMELKSGFAVNRLGVIALVLASISY